MIAKLKTECGYENDAHPLQEQAALFALCCPLLTASLSLFVVVCRQLPMDQQVGGHVQGCAAVQGSDDGIQEDVRRRSQHGHHARCQRVHHGILGQHTHASNNAQSTSTVGSGRDDEAKENSWLTVRDRELGDSRLITNGVRVHRSP